ncbi:UNVERIFIED_CONTAM: hypothetical protein HDU68_008794 [Siphonaria sp. JEL0065]|nr:hypothetical protein HDU68_008794 [Siphonaria sp. JEL0065]
MQVEDENKTAHSSKANLAAKQGSRPSSRPSSGSAKISPAPVSESKRGSVAKPATDVPAARASVAKPDAARASVAKPEVRASVAKPAAADARPSSVAKSTVVE